MKSRLLLPVLATLMLAFALPPCAQGAPKPATKAKTPARAATTADAQAEAIRKYPELGKAGSAFNVEFLARAKRYQTEKPDFAKDPAWPLKLADEVANAARKDTPPAPSAPSAAAAPVAPPPAPPVAPALKLGDLDFGKTHHVWQVDNVLLSSTKGETLISELFLNADGPGGIVAWGSVKTANGESWRMAELDRENGQRKWLYNGNGFDPPAGMSGRITSAYSTSTGNVVVGAVAFLPIAGDVRERGFYRVLSLAGTSGKITESRFSWGNFVPDKVEPLMAENTDMAEVLISDGYTHGGTPLLAATTRDGMFAVDPATGTVNVIVNFANKLV